MRSIVIIKLGEDDYGVEVNGVLTSTDFKLYEAEALKKQIEMLDEEDFQYIFEKYISLKSR